MRFSNTKDLATVLGLCKSGTLYIQSKKMKKIPSVPTTTIPLLDPFTTYPDPNLLGTYKNSTRKNLKEKEFTRYGRSRL